MLSKKEKYKVIWSDGVIMEKKKIRSRKIVKYGMAFLIPIICIVIHMIMTSCYPFGKNTILLGDSNTQYYAFFVELSGRIRQGKSIFFSWDMGLGYDFYTNFFYYLASPVNLIAVLFGGSHMELGMIVSMCIQVGLCGVTMTYFLSHTSRNKMQHGWLNDILCVVMGMAYSMCDYMLAYQYNLIWLICLLLVPVMMLGVERLIEGGDVRLYFVMLFMSFVFNFYFSWFVAMIAVIWFIDVKKDSWKMFWKRGVKFALTSMTAALSACVVLVPCFLAIVGREGASSLTEDIPFSKFGNFANLFQSFFWGHDIDIAGRTLYARNMYMGLSLLFLAVVYVFNRNIQLRARVKRLVEIALLVACLNLTGALYVLHGFTYPHLYSYRYAFILVILLIVSAFECAVNWTKPGIREGILTGVVFLVFFGGVFLANNEVQNVVCYMVTILLIIYLFMVFVLQARNSIKINSLIVNFIVILFVELISNAVYVNTDAYTTGKEHLGGTDGWRAIYNEKDNSDLNRKTSWILSQNNTVYSDTNIFSSIINTKVTWLFDALGMVYQDHGATYAYRNTTPVTALMFNVRNVLSDADAYYGGYTKEQRYNLKNDVYDIDDEIAWYTTDYAVGAGFSTDGSIKDWNVSDVVPFEVQNEFVKDVSGVEGVFTRVSPDELTDFDVKYRGSAPDRQILPDGVTLERKTDKNAYTYMNVSLDEDYHASQIYTFTAPRDMHLYVSLEDANKLCNIVTVDGNVIADINEYDAYPSPKDVLDLGELKSGQKVEIQAVNLSTVLKKGVTCIDFYEYHDDRMQECKESIKDRTLSLDTVTSTYVKGTVTANEDGILYTSIPYYRGFTAYVDGKKTDITTLANGALVGLELTAGTHTIEFRYVTYGFKLGLILSAAGWLIAVLYMVNLRRSRKKKVQAA